MYLMYGDESGDEKTIVYSVLAVPASRWQETFQRVRQFRYDLLASDGIPVTTEFHAWKFVSGRGQLGDRIVTKQRRNILFRQTLEMIAALPELRLYNAVFPVGRTEEAFEALLDSVNQSLRETNNHAMIVFDEGKEAMYTRLARKKQNYNQSESRSRRGEKQQMAFESGFWKILFINSLTNPTMFK